MGTGTGGDVAALSAVLDNDVGLVFCGVAPRGATCRTDDRAFAGVLLSLGRWVHCRGCRPYPENVHKSEPGCGISPAALGAWFAQAHRCQGRSLSVADRAHC